MEHFQLELRVALQLIHVKFEDVAGGNAQTGGIKVKRRLLFCRDADPQLTGLLGADELGIVFQLSLYCPAPVSRW